MFALDYCGVPRSHELCRLIVPLGDDMRNLSVLGALMTLWAIAEVFLAAVPATPSGSPHFYAMALLGALIASGMVVALRPIWMRVPNWACVFGAIGFAALVIMLTIAPLLTVSGLALNSVLSKAVTAIGSIAGVIFIARYGWREAYGVAFGDALAFGAFVLLLFAMIGNTFEVYGWPSWMLTASYMLALLWMCWGGLLMKHKPLPQATMPTPAQASIDEGF